MPSASPRAKAAYAPRPLWCDSLQLNLTSRSPLHYDTWGAPPPCRGGSGAFLFHTVIRAVSVEVPGSPPISGRIAISGRIERPEAVSLEGARANDLSHQISAYRMRIDCIGARRDEESYAAEMLVTLSSNSPPLHRSAS